MAAMSDRHSIGGQRRPSAWRWLDQQVFKLISIVILIGSISSSTEVVNRTGAPFIWQPLPLRATFRPLNRQAQPTPQPPEPPQPPQPPLQPSLPQPPTSPEALALISERSLSDSTTGSGENLFPTSSRFTTGSSSGPSAASSSLLDDFFTPTTAARDNSPLASFFQPPPQPPTTTATPARSTFDSSSIAALSELATTTTPATTTTTTSTTTTVKPALVDEDLPTRQPMNRFRPTQAPSEDRETSGGVPLRPPSPSNTSPPTNTTSVSPLSADCFECICEASTNCNLQSRCQTSDVRHTRCGMFLISYDQWLSTGLSRELVSREALARDAAADERAFYECVTSRHCSERLLSIYMAGNGKDCDRDGRIDCYDYAAIHHSGQDQCASETLLDSQYWSDFNGCLGFGR